MSDKPPFFGDLKRRSVIPIDYADDSISLSSCGHVNFIERSFR